VAGNVEADISQIGKRTILPSSFTGSYRNMIQNCQDALAVNRHFCGADLFITVTANPNWPEITNSLFPGQTSADRPDLISRVFRLKQKGLLDDIFKKHVLGKAVARVFTIEFQKRGLPHMHMIVYLAPESKFRTPEDVDSLISAEIPCPNTQPELFNAVTKFMIHTPCGPDHPDARCMEDGKCSKNFPKPHRDATTLSEDSYASYRRRHNGLTYNIRGQDIDNSWVVPYCPYLIWKYQCHINVECTSSMKSIKYIYKYVYKGHDRATM
jgi:hypothetical protein